MRRRALAFVLLAMLPTIAGAQALRLDTVTIQSGDFTLHALLFRPPGTGPFPAALFNHGSTAVWESHVFAFLDRHIGR